MNFLEANQKLLASAPLIVKSICKLFLNTDIWQHNFWKHHWWFCSIRQVNSKSHVRKYVKDFEFKIMDPSKKKQVCLNPIVNHFRKWLSLKISLLTVWRSSIFKLWMLNKYNQKYCFPQISQLKLNYVSVNCDVQTSL